MSEEIETARIALKFAESAEVVTAAEILRWLRSRPAPDATIAAVERATAAIGRVHEIIKQTKDK